jgi:hypothetical protein
MRDRRPKPKAELEETVLAKMMSRRRRGEQSEVLYRRGVIDLEYLFKRMPFTHSGGV